MSFTKFSCPCRALKAKRPQWILSFLDLLCSTACSVTCDPLPFAAEKPMSKSPWIQTSLPNPKGVVLYAHGLNNHNEVFRSLAEAEAEAGYLGFLLTLAGHQDAACWPALDYAEAWREDIRDAATEVRSRFPDLPMFFVGYSLGATAAMASIVEDGGSPFERAVFLAPVVAPSFRSSLIRGLTPLRYLGLGLPSLGPAGYRLHDRTALAAYSGLFELLDQVEREPAASLRCLPALLLMSENDELLSYQGTKAFLERHSLRNWTLQAILPAPKDSSLPQHLILDKNGLGEAAWKSLKSGIIDFFGVTN